MTRFEVPQIRPAGTVQPGDVVRTETGELGVEHARNAWLRRRRVRVLDLIDPLSGAFERVDYVPVGRAVAVVGRL